MIRLSSITVPTVAFSVASIWPVALTSTVSLTCPTCKAKSTRAVCCTCNSRAARHGAEALLFDPHGIGSGNQAWHHIKTGFVADGLTNRVRGCVGDGDRRAWHHRATAIGDCTIDFAERLAASRQAERSGEEENHNGCSHSFHLALEIHSTFGSGKKRVCEQSLRWLPGTRTPLRNTNSRSADLTAFPSNIPPTTPN